MSVERTLSLHERPIYSRREAFTAVKVDPPSRVTIAAPAAFLFTERDFMVINIIVLPFFSLDEVD